MKYILNKTADTLHFYQSQTKPLILFVTSQRFQGFSIDKKWHHYVCKKKNYLHKKYKEFHLFMVGVQNLKGDMVQNVWEKIAENLDFVENSNLF